MFKPNILVLRLKFYLSIYRFIIHCLMIIVIFIYQTQTYNTTVHPPKEYCIAVGSYFDIGITGYGGEGDLSNVVLKVKAIRTYDSKWHTHII